MSLDPTPGAAIAETITTAINAGMEVNRLFNTSDMDAAAQAASIAAYKFKLAAAQIRCATNPTPENEAAVQALLGA